MVTREFIQFNTFGKSIPIRWYGISYLIGYLLVRHRCFRLLEIDKHQDKKELLEKVSDISMLCGVVGGRFWYLINRYLHYGIPLHIDAIKLWEGGMAIQGGFLGGTVAAVAYLLVVGQRKELPRICDVAFSQLPLGIMIGRFGNFMNQEFMQPVEIGELLSDLLGGRFEEALYPLQLPLCLFAALTEGLALFLLTNYWIKRKDYIPYQTTYLFFFGYGCMRLLNDLFRDELQVGPLKISEYICIGLIIISSVLLLRQYFSKTDHNR